MVASLAYDGNFNIFCCDEGQSIRYGSLRQRARAGPSTVDQSGQHRSLIGCDCFGFIIHHRTKVPYRNALSCVRAPATRTGAARQHAQRTHTSHTQGLPSHFTSFPSPDFCRCPALPNPTDAVRSFISPRPPSPSNPTRSSDNWHAVKHLETSTIRPTVCWRVTTSCTCSGH